MCCVGRRMRSARGRRAAAPAAAVHGCSSAPRRGRMCPRRRAAVLKQQREQRVERASTACGDSDRGETP
eukprot:672768-Prymnesium_polylepis.1